MVTHMWERGTRAPPNPSVLTPSISWEPNKLSEKFARAALYIEISTKSGKKRLNFARSVSGACAPVNSFDAFIYMYHLNTLCFKHNLDNYLEEFQICLSSLFDIYFTHQL